MTDEGMYDHDDDWTGWGYDYGTDMMYGAAWW